MKSGRTEVERAGSVLFCSIRLMSVSIPSLHFFFKRVFVIEENLTLTFNLLFSRLIGPT